MSELKLEFVSKKVKDMYGAFIGKVVGIITDIEGSIESVSVDCGSSGLKNLPYEQLLVQGDYVIFIPRWRLDAQKLLREKSLTLKRIKALQEIVADSDDMKDEAELTYLKYEKRLDDLGENTKEIIERLNQRISELDTEGKRVKTVLFDARLQYKSNEITEDIYQQINMHTNELLDHINLERTEIKTIINKLTQQTVENNVNTPVEIKEEGLNPQNENSELLEYNNHQIHRVEEEEEGLKNEVENHSSQEMTTSIVTATSPGYASSPNDDAEVTDDFESSEDNGINQIVATNNQSTELN